MMMGSQKGQNNEHLLNRNRALIVQHLQSNKVCTRSQLSKALGLTPASITKTIASLIESGLVEETGFLQGEKGRRSIGLRLRNINKIIGVKLSRRTFSVGVFDFNGETFSSHAESFDEEQTLTAVLEKIKRETLDALGRFPEVIAIGMAVPGPYLIKEFRIALVTETKGWENVDLQAYFAGSFDVPLIIAHDANSSALAEWWFNPQIKAQGGTHIHFLVGEGVGAGVVEDGEVLLGENGIAGEIGHISIDVNGRRCACGNYGCLELFCSSLAFVKHAKAQLAEHPESLLRQYQGNSLTHQAIFQAANQNDPLAVSLVQRAGRHIGYGIVNLINAYDPATIVIGNDLSGGGAILLQAAKDVVKERTTSHVYEQVSIGLSALGVDPVLYGAAAVAMDYCLNHPDVLISHAKASIAQGEV